MDSFTRRAFLSKAATVSTGIGLAMAVEDMERAEAERKDRPEPIVPNERVVMGFIGLGGMGLCNLRDFMRCPEVAVAAVCDVHAERRCRAAEHARSKGHRPAEYNDFREIIDRDDVDAVCISTPDHWHAIPAIMACMSGKDVYAEKPLAQTIKQGRAMLDAARRHGRVTQLGTQLRSGAHFRRAVGIVQSRVLGKINLTKTWTMGHGGSMGYPPNSNPPPGLDWDLWLGPSPYHPYNPARCHGTFRFFFDTAGGTLADWGTLLLDVVHWALRVDSPLAVSAKGGKYLIDDCRDTPDTLEVVYDYPGFEAIHSVHDANGYPYWTPTNLRPPVQQDGTWFRPLRPWAYGIAFFGEHGTMFLNGDGFVIVPSGDRVQAAENAGAQQHLSHVRDFLRCIKTRERCRSDFEAGHRSTIAPHLGNIAYWAGRKVHWDGEREQVTGDPDADRLTDRPLRAPWHL